MKLNSLSKILLGVSIAFASASASAAIEVQVGYADNIRPSPFFPSPWQGDPSVSFFAGQDNGGSFDTGAIRVINNGATPVTFDGLTVSGFGDGSSYTLWNGYIGDTIAAGQSAIFVQTSGYNFDSSDNEGSNPFAIPVVTLDINGTTTSFNDTAQVLNTEGTDHLAAANLNESHQWRDIGTYGGQAAVPEPEQWAMIMLGLPLISLVIRRKKA